METITAKEINSKIKTFTYGYAIFWLFDRINVQSCPYKDEKIDTDNLVECRIFNDKKEILIRRKGDGFVFREKTDTNEDKKNYITKTAIVRGEIAKQIKDLKGLISLIKHEYIDYNDQGAATFVDSRFVDFKIQND